MELYASRLASYLRARSGRMPLKRRGSVPNHQLTLYEYEASPWARLCREHITYLNLTVLIKPTPRQTLRTEGAYNDESRFRGEAHALCVKHGLDFQFPLLVDDTGDRKVIGESKNILDHLWCNYGENVGEEIPTTDALLGAPRVPFPFRFAAIVAPSLIRCWPSCGLLRTPSAFEGEPLALFANESSPDGRLIRETLCSLELPYVRRQSLAGPDDALLVDSNHKVEYSDYKEARLHLKRAYALGPTTALWAPIPEPNLGKSRWFFHRVLSARRRGRETFLPESALQKRDC